MELDRRALLISLASSAAMLALPEGAAGAPSSRNALPPRARTTAAPTRPLCSA